MNIRNNFFKKNIFFFVRLCKNGKTNKIRIRANSKK